MGLTQGAYAEPKSGRVLAPAQRRTAARGDQAQEEAAEAAEVGQARVAHAGAGA
jgi:hypothetical protein